MTADMIDVNYTKNINDANDVNDADDAEGAKKAPAPEKGPDARKLELYLRQTEMLKLFLKNGAITRAQYEKSFGDLTKKMGFTHLYPCQRSE